MIECSVCKRPYERLLADTGKCVPCELAIERERVAELRKQLRTAKARSADELAARRAKSNPPKWKARKK